MTISLPERFTIRPATLDDVEAVVAVLNACSSEEVGKPTWDIDEVRSQWTSPSFRLENDTRVVIAPKGTPIAAIGLWDAEPHVRAWAWAGVHPDYRGQGIGTALCQWAEHRTRQAIPKAPPGARVVLRQEIVDTNTAARELLCSRGHQLVRHSFYMAIDLDGPPPQPVLPPGVAIRSFVRHQDLRALILAEREAFRDHWGYVESPVEKDYGEWIHWLDSDPNHDPSLWFLAIDGDEIAGASLCIPKVAEDPEMGLVEDLFVRRPWRRRGVALALLHHSFGVFHRRGKRRVGLGVDAQSLTGATRLYERAGMYVERRYATYELELRPGTDLTTQTVA